MDRSRAARLFELSLRLEGAAVALSHLAGGAHPSDRERDSMKWAAQFLENFDPGATGEISSRLSATDVTTIAPSYYGTFLQLRNPLTKANVTTVEAARRFIDRLLSVMARAEMECDDAPVATLGSGFLHEFARALLARSSSPSRSQHRL